MPVYNNTLYLRESIDSILNQTYEDFEFIILDDDSTEAVWEIMSGYNDPRIICVKNKENIGLTKSLNICLDMAKGDYIARQDSDDISKPKRFEEELKLFDNESVGMVSCWGETVHHKYPEVKKTLRDHYLDKLVRSVKDEDIKETLLEKNCILGPAAIYRKEVVDKIGYYDEELYFAQDYNYWLRISDFFDISIVKKNLYLRRKNPKSVRSDDRHADKRVNILEKVKGRAKTHTIIK